MVGGEFTPFYLARVKIFFTYLVHTNFLHLHNTVVGPNSGTKFWLFVLRYSDPQLYFRIILRQDSYQMEINSETRRYG